MFKNTKLTKEIWECVEQIRKMKVTDPEFKRLTSRLLELEAQLRRFTRKVFADGCNTLHFESGDLRKLCCALKNKLKNRILKELNKNIEDLYYESYHKEMDEVEVIDNAFYDDIIKRKTQLYDLATMVLALHFCLCNLEATVSMIEHNDFSRRK